MPADPVLLKIEDHEQVKELCATVWDGNDYVPTAFPHWITDSHFQTAGIFEGNELVAIAALEFVPETTIAWVIGLRVKEEYRQRGLAKTLTDYLVKRATDAGIRTLWYATSSRNEASQKVALKLGFREADKVGYFRLYDPYPPHQKPSLSYIPLKVNAERLYEILQHNPELVESTTIPFAWEFEFTSREGLERLARKTEFRVIVGDDGIAHALYFRLNRMRNEETTAAFTIFATDRSIFVDVLARTIDEAVSQRADRAVYFLGPRTTEWALATGFVTEEFIGRQFLLYEINPIAKSETHEAATE